MTTALGTPHPPEPPPPVREDDRHEVAAESTFDTTADGSIRTADVRANLNAYLLKRDPEEFRANLRKRYADRIARWARQPANDYTEAVPFCPAEWRCGGKVIAELENTGRSSIVRLYDSGGAGFGNTPREAYTEAYRDARLRRHDLATVLADLGRAQQDADLWKQLYEDNHELARQLAGKVNTLWHENARLRHRVDLLTRLLTAVRNLMELAGGELGIHSVAQSEQHE